MGGGGILPGSPVGDRESDTREQDGEWPGWGHGNCVEGRYEAGAEPAIPQGVAETPGDAAGTAGRWRAIDENEGK